MSELKPLTEAETTELLDWVSACQSSYHIDSTPGHRFGGLGSNLQENRESLVEYVNELIAARAQPAQAGQVPELTSTEVNDACWAFVEALPHQLHGAIFNDLKPAIYAAICKYLEQAVLAKRVPMTRPQRDAMSAEVQRRANQLENEGRYTFGGWFPIAVEMIEAHHGIVGEKGGA